jgi:hypothetical protein
MLPSYAQWLGWTHDESRFRCCLILEPQPHDRVWKIFKNSDQNRIGSRPRVTSPMKNRFQSLSRSSFFSRHRPRLRPALRPRLLPPRQLRSWRRMQNGRQVLRYRPRRPRPCRRRGVPAVSNRTARVDSFNFGQLPIRTWATGLQQISTLHRVAAHAFATTARALFTYGVPSAHRLEVGRSEKDFCFQHSVAFLKTSDTAIMAFVKFTRSEDLECAGSASRRVMTQRALPRRHSRWISSTLQTKSTATLNRLLQVYRVPNPLRKGRVYRLWSNPLKL